MLRITFTRSKKIGESCSVKNEIARPFFPARPVRPASKTSFQLVAFKICRAGKGDSKASTQVNPPMRCMYCSISFGISKFTTSVTPSTSMPRPATSVATNTSYDPSCAFHTAPKSTNLNGQLRLARDVPDNNTVATNACLCRSRRFEP